MPDLIYILNDLTDSHGQIQIPGIMDDVAPLMKNEEKIYDDIEFDVSAYHAEINATELRHKGDKVSFLDSNTFTPHLLAFQYQYHY